MTHVLQVLFLSVFILQVVMHGEESQVPGDLRTRTQLNIGSEFRCSRRKITFLLHLWHPS
jgi:hypothetical protein